MQKAARAVKLIRQRIFYGTLGPGNKYHSVRVRRKSRYPSSYKPKYKRRRILPPHGKTIAVALLKTGRPPCLDISETEEISAGVLSS